MKVMIGIDPHKASHTAVAIDEHEGELAALTVRANRTQLDKLLAWAAPFEKRTWAIESAGGLGYLLGQQLLDAGEDVLDVPATLASRVRVLSSGRSDKNDPNDALSVAVAALRTPALRAVEAANQAAVLRLLAKRTVDLGSQRTRLVGRMHAALVELTAGGIAKELNASDARRFLDEVKPTTPVEAIRHQLALELLDDLVRIDAQLKASHKRIRDAMKVSNSSVTDLFGIGPIIGAMLIGYTGDVLRYWDRDHYASYNGTAPIEMSSGGRIVHRLSRRGNRQLNHALHLAALCQIRQAHSQGRAYFDRRVAQGKTKKEALRALKRHISNAVYRQLLNDARRPLAGPGGQLGNDS